MASVSSGPQLPGDPTPPGGQTPVQNLHQMRINSTLLPGTLGFKLPLYPDVGLHQRVRGPRVTTVTRRSSGKRLCLRCGAPWPDTLRGQKQKAEGPSEAAALSNLVRRTDTYLHHRRWRIQDVLRICIVGSPVTPPGRLCRQRGGRFRRAAGPACSP